MGSFLAEKSKPIVGERIREQRFEFWFRNLRELLAHDFVYLIFGSGID